MSDQPTACYEHEILDLRRQSFRLLKLKHKANNKDDITIEVRNFNLDDAPDFKALSYTWGSPEPLHSVHIGNRRMTVRENLHHFLRTARKVRKFCEHTWLWIDQLCIDQSLLEERNHQVNLMSSIYQHACEVIIWLGLGFRSCDYFMDIVKRWPIGATHFQQYNLSRPVLSAVLKDAKKLAQCGYWRRLWIHQEIILAQKLVVFMGMSEIEWDKLCLFSDDVASSRFLEATGWREVSLRQCLGTLNEHFQAKRRNNYAGMSWMTALSMARDCSCEDIRDKAYGMLGLVWAGVDLQADYSLSVEDLCLKIISTSIESEERWPEVEVLKTYARLARLCWKTFEVYSVTDSQCRDFIEGKLLSRWTEICPFDAVGSKSYLLEKETLRLDLAKLSFIS